MAQLKDLKVKISLDTSQFQKEIDNVGRQTSSLSSTIQKVGGVVAGAFATKAVIDFGKKVAGVGIEYNALRETSKATWETLLGSQDAAIEQLERIEKFAASTPYSKMGVDTMAKHLHNAGFEGQAVFDKLTEIGNMGSAFGVQEESLIEMVRQFSQVQQAGTAYTEDLNILQERSIPILEALAEQTGLTVAEIKNMASEGKISADMYNQALESIATTTDGAMKLQSETFSGMMSTLQDNLSTLSGLLTEQVFEALKGLVEWLNPGIEKFNEIYKETGSFTEALKGALEQIGLEDWVEFAEKVKDMYDRVKELTEAFFENEELLTLVAIGVGTLTAAIVAFNAATIISTASMVAQEVILNAMIIAETIATAATTALATAMAFLTSPITLVILIIGALIAIIYLLITHWDEVKEAAAKCWDWIVQKWQGACEWFKNTVIEPLKKWWNDFWGGIKTWASEAWEGIKGIWNACVGWFNDTIINPVKTKFSELWNGIKEFLSNPLEGIKGMFRNAFNWIIDKMNWVIDGLNKFQVPDWVPLIGGKGVNIPRIPRLWKGTNFTIGGPTLVGEQGPELVNMPRGASVMPAHKTRSALEGVGKTEVVGRQTANIYVELDGRTLTKVVGANLVDTVRLKTGLSL